MVEELFAQRRKIEEMDLKLSSENKILAQMEAAVVMALKELGRKNYQSPHGTVGITNKWRVNLPQTDADKAKLFDWMRERGIYERYVTVNSNSLNSLFLEEWDAAKKRGEGMEFRLPGVPEPKLFERLTVTKKGASK
jgi:hypothetical protein